MEAEVAALLEAAGAHSARAVAEAEEALAMKALSVEEARERQNRLARMRALLFYHEARWRVGWGRRAGGLRGPAPASASGPADALLSACTPWAALSLAPHASRLLPLASTLAPCRPSPSA